MISLNNRIRAFATLGEFLVKVGDSKTMEVPQNLKLTNLELAVSDAPNYNGWFVEDNVRFMLKSIGQSLAKNNIEKWVAQYKVHLLQDGHYKTIGVVMAGNVPVVGFHDFLSVLMSGNKILAKLSADDNKLLPAIADLLIDIEPDFKNMIDFTSDRLINFDAIIATGSNNTSRYFEYYFGKYPNIIRKNRNSVALITGDESNDDLRGLSKDIFTYYGLGCRNVSHIILPNGYDMKNMLDVFSENTKVIENHKYFNNYEYNKAIYLVNSKQHFDTGNLLVTEDLNFSSPVSTIHFSYYNKLSDAAKLLEVKSLEIQCVVSVSASIKNAVTPGFGQQPQLWDYADGVDTMRFLTEL